MLCKARLAFAVFAALTLVCAAPSLQAAPSKNAIGILTGPKTGTYYAFGKDIAQAASKNGMDVEVKSSEGSIDNIKRINSAENAPVGIVQSDVLGFLSRSKSPESIRMASSLRMIFPFYNEEVHVLARNSIRSFADLQGKRVAIGEEGSGNMLTAINLFAMMGITPGESRKIPSAQGVVSVLKGELDAVIFVGGKPVRLFKNLEELSLPENQKYSSMLEQVHFVPLDSPKMLEEYRPAKITKADYSFVREPVPTIAVQAVMVSYDLSQKINKKRCEKLGALTRLIRKELPSLREKGHPKWKEVNLDADSGSWKKDSCAWPEAKPDKKAAKADKPDKTDKAGLMKILDKTKN